MAPNSTCHRLGRGEKGGGHMQLPGQLWAHGCQRHLVQAGTGPEKGGRVCLIWLHCCPMQPLPGCLNKQPWRQGTWAMQTPKLQGLKPKDSGVEVRPRGTCLCWDWVDRAHPTSAQVRLTKQPWTLWGTGRMGHARPETSGIRGSGSGAQVTGHLSVLVLGGQGASHISPGEGDG